MRALHFGAGNIGRGFIGKLLADAGITLTFADVDQVLIDALNHFHGYQVHVVSEKEVIEEVTGVNAVNSNSEQASTLVAQVDLITSAVGPSVLGKIAHTLAKGLMQRQQQNNPQALNIIACENMVRASSQLKQQVYEILPASTQAWADNHVGFVDCAVDRIVPPTTGSTNSPLTVTVETFSEWIVDKTQFKGTIPQITGMELTDNLLAFLERKLFTLNTGHAISAYLGKQSGHQTIREAILDPAIRSVVHAAMEESGAVLIKRFGFSPSQHSAYIDKIIQRFENPYLHDDVERVGRQPLRKLSANDRLIKPLLGTLEYGLPHDNLVQGIAAALHYRNDNDPQAQELGTLIATDGVESTLARISGLPAKSAVVAEIVAAYRLMQN